MLLSLLLLVPALSYFWSVNLPFWAERTRVRLPFFVLPWAFANLPLLSARQYRGVLYLLFWVMVLLCIGVGIHFALHADVILDGLQHGRPVPVPRNHIRFNLLAVTALIAGGWLWQQRFYWRYTWERRVLAGALIFLFVFLHILSVRSGLVALYTAFLFTIIYLVIHTRRWKMGLVALALLLSLPILAYQLIPSLQQRISYMRYDWNQYRQEAGSHYSDSERWTSLRSGWLLWQQHPLLGVGAGDLPMEVQRMANERFPHYTLEPKLPHNQFLYILVGTGLLGLILSLTALLAPFTVRYYRRFYLFAAFQVVLFVSFLVEYTLETAIGVAFYLFFTLWFMKIAEKEREN